jgi:hypothetical protein
LSTEGQMSRPETGPAPRSRGGQQGLSILHQALKNKDATPKGSQVWPPVPMSQPPPPRSSAISDVHGFSYPTNPSMTSGKSDHAASASKHSVVLHGPLNKTLCPQHGLRGLAATRSLLISSLYIYQ